MVMSKLRNRIGNQIVRTGVRMMTPDRKLSRSRVLGGYSNPLRILANRFDLSDEGFSLAVTGSVWVYRCVMTRATSITGLDFKVVGPDGVELEDSPFHRALDWSWVRYQQDLLMNHIASLSIWGENYEEKLITPEVPGISPGGLPGGLRWLNPLAVEPYVEYGAVQYFEYMAEADYIRFETNELGYHHTFNPRDDVRGLGAVQLSLEGVNIERSIAEYIQAFFDNDATPGGVISGRQGMDWLDEEDAEQVIRDWEDQNSGSGNAFKVALLPYALQFEKFDNSPPQNQSEMEESLVKKIHAAFMVPMSMTGAGGVSDPLSAGSTMTAQKAQFFEEYTEPTARELERYYNAVIFPWLCPGCELIFDTESVRAMVEQTKERVEMFSFVYDRGAMSRNELREKSGLEPRDEFEMVFIPGLGLVPESKIGIIAEITLERLQNEATAASFPGGFNPSMPLIMSQPNQIVPPPLPSSSSRSVPGPRPIPTHLLSSTNSVNGKSSVGNPSGAVIGQFSEIQNLSTILDLFQEQFPPNSRVRWTPVENLHVTLVYSTLIDDQDYEMVFQEIQGQVSPQEVQVASVDIFKQDDSDVLVLLLGVSDELKTIQEKLFSEFKRLGVPLSVFSEPETWTPHVTLGYGHPGIFDDLDLSVSGLSLVMDHITFSRTSYYPQMSINMDKSPELNGKVAVVNYINDVYQELKRWEQFVLKRVGKSEPRPFEPEHIPIGVAREIQDMLDQTDGDKDTIKAIFHWSRNYLGSPGGEISNVLSVIKSASVDESALSLAIDRLRGLGMEDILEGVDSLEDDEDEPDELLEDDVPIDPVN